MSSWLIGTAAGWSIFIGGLAVLYHLGWKVEGPVLYRVYQHCRNFCIGAALAFGIIVCLIGFLWDIGVV